MELEKACALHWTVLYYIGLKDSVLLRHDSPKPCLKETMCVCVCSTKKQTVFLIDLHIKNICTGNGQILDHVNTLFSLFEEEAEQLEKNMYAYCWQSNSKGVLSLI